jgi:hypothetical protein
VGGVIATPNVMCRWVDRSAAEEVRTVLNGKCFRIKEGEIEKLTEKLSEDADIPIAIRPRKITGISD